MTLHTIKLPLGEWSFDDQARLGDPGGFGEVFKGKGASGEVAVKRLNLDANQAAHRELDIGKRLIGASYKHVVPILDAGQDAQSDRYYLIMPICECSLEDRLKTSQQPIDIGFAKEVIISVLNGLSEVSDIAHRDIKPANILFHEGSWKLADFGIAKFVEDATSTQTLRGCLTPLYAAPEQWRGDRSTAATDIYALGCIAYRLFNGATPFVGDYEELRDQHLEKSPEFIGGIPSRISSFMGQMLRKAPQVRPSVSRCLEIFSIPIERWQGDQVATAVLDNAARMVLRERIEQEARNLEIMNAKKAQEELLKEAGISLKEIQECLYREIKSASEDVQINSSGKLIFGRAELDFPKEPQRLDRYHDLARLTGSFYSQSKWDVIAWGLVRLKCNRNGSTSGCSSTLLFVDRHDGGGYRWYELAFIQSFSQRGVGSDEPFGLEGHNKDIDIALGPAMHTIALAYGPYAIDGEDQYKVIHRWVNFVSIAAIGELNRAKILRPGVDLNSFF